MKIFKGLLKRSVLLSAVLFLSAGNAFSQDTLSVEEALQIGLQNNFSIRIAANASNIAENNNSLGNAGVLPVLSAVGSRSYSIQDSRQEFAGSGIPDNTTENARSNTINGSVTLNWTVFDGLQMFTTYEKLKELENLGEQQFRLTVETSVAQIIAAYYNIIRQQKIFDVLQSTVDISEQRIRIAETRKDLGSGSEYDLLQARADLNADRAAVIRQEILLKNAKIRLNELTGRDVALEYAVEQTIPSTQDLVYNNLLQRAMSDNQALTIARINQEVAELEIREIRGERYPVVNLTTGYSYNRSESGAGFLELNQTDGFNYGLTARLNIFDGFNVNRRIENAQIQLKNQELALQEQKLGVEAELSSVFKRYLNSLELVKLESENLTYAQQSLEIALERFKLGTINSIELREVQRTLISAESRLIQAQFEAKVAETELLRISGQLTERVE